MRQLPNAITVLRLFLLPLLIWAVVNGESLLAVATLAAMAFSDLLDGWLARKYKITSRFGALFDPIADKVVQVTTLALLVAQVHPAFAPVDAWFFGVLVARDLLLLYGTLRIGRRHHTVVVKARWEGRLSTLLVFALIFGVLLGANRTFVLVLEIMTAPIAIAAAVHYVVDGRKQYLGPPR